MKGFFIGCGVVAVLVIGGLVVGGLWVYNQAAPLIGQGIQQLQKLETELQKISPDLKGLNVALNTNNGKTTLKLAVPVGFDPSSGKQAEQTAQQVLAVVRQHLPQGLPATALELRLFRDMANGGKQERTFNFALTPTPRP
jgi:hypothetical protein